MIMAARYISVIPLAHMINFHSRFNHPGADLEIPRNHQLMIWWAGLRGAIAFALSHDVQGEETQAIQTTILVVCVVSVIILGGTTPFALDYLKIQTGVAMDYSEGEEDVIEEARRDSLDSDVLPTVPPSHWFLNFDQKYLKPVFCSPSVVNDLESPARQSLLLSSRSA